MMAAAAKKATDNGPAMQKIIALLKTRHEEDGALIDELERLAGGGRGIGEILKELYAYWNELWSIEHGGSYVFVFAQDAPQMKRLYRELGLEELQARIYNYIKDRDEWLVKNKHPFKVFVAQSNRHASGRAVVDGNALPPVGCKHKPPCRSDQEHTQKVLAG